uniref:NADH-ubiquinone oxidoreductase chain 1 n=1 Tax=Diversibipalium mayottensis TaxID=3348909 RepID=A0A8K1X7A0_9PLAT|nr:NADH dehydrogenase subunit 1 [Diversibipalium sp. MNHN JL281]
MVSVIVCVLFFTMFERKVLSYMQLRKGPNKVGFVGLGTPLADTIKLLIKLSSLTSTSNVLVYYVGPVVAIFVLFVVWGMFPFVCFNNIFAYGFVVFLCLSSLNLYSVLGSGWGSNSKYSMLGAFRGVAQIVSYEVVLIFVSFFPISFQGGYMLHGFLGGYLYVVWFAPLFLLWMLSCVAETNRAPFDFAEGESELVSGFNTEYGALEFAFLFLGEYGQIIFISFLSVLLYVYVGSQVVLVGLGVVVAVWYIWFRATYPRFRYDLFMELAWNIGLVFIVWVIFYLLAVS